MLQDMVHHEEQLPIEEITSPIGAHQIFEFCESELFPETLQYSEVASNSNCCYDEHSSYSTNLSITPEMNKFTNSIDTNTYENENKQIINNNNPVYSTAPSTPTITSTTIHPNSNTVKNNNNCDLSIIFDPQEDHEHDISASIDFTPSPSFSMPQYLHSNDEQDHQFNLSILNNQISITDITDGTLQQYTTTDPSPPPPRPPPLPLMGPPMPPHPNATSYEDECLSSLPPYMRMRSSSPSCSLLDPIMPPYLHAAGLNTSFSAENSGILAGASLLLGTELTPQDLEFQGDSGGFFLPDTIPRVFNCSSDLQALSNESQHLVHGGGNSTPLASEISSLEDSTYKVSKISAEEREQKLHRYRKKRHERNFSKKIKYACRKTLADSRPRVRGRFAKNDELGEAARTTCSNHEEDTDDDLFSNANHHRPRKMLKEEDDMVDSSDIFAHISGVNSFKCNYPIQSWI